MASEFYKIYNDILSNSRKKDIKNENTTVSAGIASQAVPSTKNQDSYAKDDARRGKSLFNTMYRRVLDAVNKNIKGLKKPKEVK